MNIKLFMGKFLIVVGKLKYLLILLLILFIAGAGWAYRNASTEKQWKSATDHYRKADYDGAAKILNKLSIPQDDPERLGIYAQTMLATRQLDKSAEAYTRLYELKKDPFSKVVLGNIYNEQKQYDKAAKTYQEVIDANPTYAQAYVNLATMYKLQNKNKEAISTAALGVKNNPSNTVLLELMVSLTMNDKKSPEFKAAVEKLKQVNPKDPLLELIEQQD